MMIVTEPHGRRDDCDACKDESVHFLCSDCGEHRIVTHNGHHDHQANPLDVCTCGSKMEEMHRAFAILEDGSARPLRFDELPEEVKVRFPWYQS